MKAPLARDEILAVTDWSKSNFSDADGKLVTPGDFVQLTRDITAYSERGDLVAPLGSFATVVGVSQRRSIASLDMAIGDEQAVAAYEKTSRLRRARAADRLKEKQTNA